MEPHTLFEKQDDVRSGGRVLVRGAAFSVGGAPHGGVTLTIHVPKQHGLVHPDGSVSATLLLNPDEGLGIAEWLREAFRAADPVGPPLYGDEATPST